jgi:hypothetical protein
VAIPVTGSVKVQNKTATTTSRAPKSSAVAEQSKSVRSIRAALGRQARVSADDVAQLMGLAGNATVSRMVARSQPVPLTLQREFEDADKVADDAVGVMRGPAAGPVNPVVRPESRNEFGEMDGSIGSDVAPHAFTDGGRVGESAWHHCGGGGGKGVENLGAATLVAPVYKTKPAPPGGEAKAWIQDGTGKIKVTRSFMGVTHGPQGAYTAPPVGTVWMSPRGRERVDKHERVHTKKTKEIYDLHIAPLEKRISKYRGFLKAKKKGTDEAAAQNALQTEIDWNASVKDFADKDTQQNTPMGPVDVNDMNKADFYQDYDTSPKFQAKSNCTVYEGVGASKKKKT